MYFVFVAPVRGHAHWTHRRLHLVVALGVGVLSWASGLDADGDSFPMMILLVLASTDGFCCPFWLTC